MILDIKRNQRDSSYVFSTSRHPSFLVHSYEDQSQPSIFKLSGDSILALGVASLDLGPKEVFEKDRLRSFIGGLQDSLSTYFIVNDEPCKGMSGESESEFDTLRLGLRNSVLKTKDHSSFLNYLLYWSQTTDLTSLVKTHDYIISSPYRKAKLVSEVLVLPQLEYLRTGEFYL